MIDLAAVFTPLCLSSLMLSNMPSDWRTLSTASCPTYEDCDKSYFAEVHLILSLLGLLVPRSAVLSRIHTVAGLTKPSLTSR